MVSPETLLYQSILCVTHNADICPTSEFHLENGRILFRKPNAYETNIKLKAIHICNSGYTLVGNVFRKCRIGFVGNCISKQWSGNNPKCVPGKYNYDMK